jgi:serine protease Do
MRRNEAMTRLLVATTSALAIVAAAPTLSPIRAQTPPPSGSVAAATPQSFADIVEKVRPAVVSIDVTRRSPSRRQPPQIFPFPFPFGPPGGDLGPPPEGRVSGSGFFISASGYIVTNNHVVEDATRVTVKLDDERELPARVIGRDALTDLAVLKVEGSDFPFVSFATQARPRVGDWVIAVGAPFGLGGTATTGIVSAYARDIGEAYVDFLQIDAPINRGNSGGPTFDVYGRVIGVNTAIFSPSGGSVGIGFAIPADVADGITRQLISRGSIARGYLGATIQNLSPEIAEGLAIAGRKGAVVVELAPGGPAAVAGLQPGDVILGLNGQPVASSTDLTRRVGRSGEGEALRLEVWRDGRTQSVEVRSGLRPAEAQLNGEAPSDENPATLGLSLRPLDEAARRQYRLPPDQIGVVIDSVAPGSDAARKGFRPGDVIERIGTRLVSTQADIAAAVAEARRLGRGSVVALVVRNGRRTFIPLDVPSAREGR